MTFTSNDTSYYQFDSFQSSATSCSNYKVEVNWKGLYEIGFPMRLYLPSLPMIHSKPFRGNLKIEQFKGHQFKLGKSKK